MASNPQASAQGDQVKKSSSRGRIVASRYLNPSASTSRTTLTAAAATSKPTAKSSVKPVQSSAHAGSSNTQTRGTAAKPAKTPIGRSGSVARTETSSLRGGTNSTGSVRGKIPAGASSSTLSQHGAAAARPAPPRPIVSSPTPDTLQLAAHIHAWQYMSATLESQLETSKQAADTALRTVSEKLSAEEADIADARVRLEAERLLDFYGELSDAAISSTVPAVVQGFLRHDDACSKLVSGALALASHPLNENADVREYSKILDRIDELDQESEQLESSIISISKHTSQVREARVIPALLALLPVLRAHGANLISVRTLIQGCKDNLHMALQDFQGVMSASISDPFLLSSYALPPRLSRLSGSSSSSERPAHVFVADRYALSGERGDGLVTVAVQGDGVHVLDLSTLHPAISHTLGPSTTFSCPPVTRTTYSSGVQTCTTFAVVASSPEIRKEDGGRIVWVWEEHLTGGVMSGDAQKKRKSAVMPRPISHIHVADDVPGRVLLVDSTGALAIADMELNILTPFDEQNPLEETTLFRHFAFPRKSCPFVSDRTAPSQGVIVVSVSKTGGGLSLHLNAVDSDGRTSSLGKCILDVAESDIIDISFSPSGYITVLAQSGVWHSFHLSTSPVSPSTLVVIRPTEPLHLASLSFTTSTNAPTTSNHPHQAEHAILALTSSHVLVTSVSTLPGSNAELALLLWDMQYGVLLAEQRCSVPSTLGRTRQHGVRIHLFSQSQGQAILLLSPAVDLSTPRLVDNANVPLRSSVLVVPYTVPPMSTIANVLGHASAGEKWLKPEGSARKSSSQASGSDLNPAQRKLLLDIRGAMEKRQVETAEKAFDEWVKTEESKVQMQGQTTTNLHVAPTPTSAEAREDEGAPYLGHLFVKQLLDIALPVSGAPGLATVNGKGSSSLPHAPKMVRYLLERRAVSDGMVVGGLISALMARQDWTTAILAMQMVNDLPEADVVSLLARVISHHRQTSSDENAMQVDSSSGMPTLPSFLALCITYSMSPAALRVALHEHLTDAEDLMSVLAVVDGWIERWCQEEVKLLPDRVKKDAHGVPVALYTEGDKQDLPPLDKILEFTQSILDACFLVLLVHQPAHAPLRALLSRLQPELVFISELQSLYGPLQPFAAAHARAVHEGAHGPPKTDTKVDWRRRKKVVHEQAEMALGLYQVEELVI